MACGTGLGERRHHPHVFPQMGKDVVVQKVGDTILSNETVRGSLNMVSINTKYPEKCLQLLDLINTDTKLRDMFYYGEEGVNFRVHRRRQGTQDQQRLGDGRLHTGFLLHSNTGGYRRVQPVGRIKELNEQAVSSVMLDLHSTRQKCQINLQTAVKSDMLPQEVMTGVQPGSVVPKIKEELSESWMAGRTGRSTETG